MKKVPLVKLISGILTVTVIYACSKRDEDLNMLPGDALGAVAVFVNIPPQAYLVERIGGDLVDVKVLVPPGRDPHDFTPTPRVIVELSRSDIYFHGLMPFGLELVRRVRSTGAGTRIVDITEGVDLRAIEAECCHDHAHSGHDHHRHEGMDPHVWLSPPEIKVQVANITAALQNIDPDNRAEYAANRELFLQELEAAHRKLQASLAPYRGRTFYVYHPAFGYFARTYGLRQQAVEVGGRSPSPRHLRQLITMAREEGVRVIFVQPQFEGRSVNALAEAIDGAVIPLDPLAYDILANLLQIGESIATVMLQHE